MARTRKKTFGPYGFETSNEDKVLFEDIGLAKGDLIEYYEGVTEVMVPHLRDRPLMLQRFPDGIAADGFYQKQASDHFPEWIETVRVDKAEGGSQDLVVCQNQATLAYLANQGSITFHTWSSRSDHLDLLVFDLDPPGADFGAVRRAAEWLHALLDELELPSFPKTTGSKGLHVVVPLDRSAGFDAVRSFARRVAEQLAAEHPQELTTEQYKSQRGERVFLDVGRNAYAQTAVAPYSVRPLPGAPVATPLDWDELADEDLGPRTYTVENLRRRLRARHDPWKAMGRRARSLAAALERIERLEDEGRGA